MWATGCHGHVSDFDALALVVLKRGLGPRQKKKWLFLGIKSKLRNTKFRENCCENRIDLILDETLEMKSKFTGDNAVWLYFAVDIPAPQLR